MDLVSGLLTGLPEWMIYPPCLEDRPPSTTFLRDMWESRSHFTSVRTLINLLIDLRRCLIGDHVSSFSVITPCFFSLPLPNKNPLLLQPGSSSPCPDRQEILIGKRWVCLIMRLRKKKGGMETDWEKMRIRGRGRAWTRECFSLTWFASFGRASWLFLCRNSQGVSGRASDPYLAQQTHTHKQSVAAGARKNGNKPRMDWRICVCMCAVTHICMLVPDKSLLFSRCLTPHAPHTLLMWIFFYSLTSTALLANSLCPVPQPPSCCL